MFNYRRVKSSTPILVINDRSDGQYLVSLIAELVDAVYDVKLGRDGFN